VKRLVSCLQAESENHIQDASYTSSAWACKHLLIFGGIITYKTLRQL